MNNDEVRREQLLQLLRGGNAHIGFEEAVKSFPMEAINTKPPNVPYSPWHLVEHIRIAQLDILEFMRDPDYAYPDWPDDYWPSHDAIADEAIWNHSIEGFRGDMKAIEDIVKNKALDLTSEIPHAPGYTYFREILLVADHNAYHIGEFAILRQVMDTW